MAHPFALDVPSETARWVYDTIVGNQRNVVRCGYVLSVSVHTAIFVLAGQSKGAALMYKIEPIRKHQIECPFAWIVDFGRTAPFRPTEQVTLVSVYARFGVLENRKKKRNRLRFVIILATRTAAIIFFICIVANCAIHGLLYQFGTSISRKIEFWF